MNPVIAHRRSARLVLAALIASGVASFVPAQAFGALAPILGATSVDSGWTSNARLIAATFDKNLDMAASTVIVVDRNGAPVTGSGFVNFVSQKTIQFNPQAPFSGLGAPYSVTFTARSVGQDLGIASVPVERTFSVDEVIPFPPNVTFNGVASPVTMSASSDELLLTGVAKDNADGSGVAKITVHFYNPAANPHQATTGGVPEASRQTVVIACSPVCPVETPVNVDLSTLKAGLWTIKVSATDAAGNRSVESNPLRVLRVAA